MDDVKKTFGSLFPDALYYNFKYALRFELAGGANPKKQAFDRATTLLNACRYGDDGWVALFSNYDERIRPASLATRRTRLTKYGDFDIKRIGKIKQPEDDPFYRQFFSVAPLPAVETVLDVNFTEGLHDFGEFYLVNLEERLVVYPYDVRGMDAVAMKSDGLQTLYDRYSDWLLDYDRQRMDAVFGQ